MHLFVFYQVEGVLTLVSPLVQDQTDQPEEEEDPEDFAEEQGLMGRFVHQLKANDPNQQYLVSGTVSFATCSYTPSVIPLNHELCPVLISGYLLSNFC